MQIRMNKNEFEVCIPFAKMLRQYLGHICSGIQIDWYLFEGIEEELWVYFWNIQVNHLLKK